MEDQTKILINIDEYKEFIINQYEQGKLKASLNQEIKELRRTRDLKIMEITELQHQAQKLKDTVLDIMFRKERMGADTRQEQTYLESSYFGFDPYKIEYLKGLGYTEEQLIEYVNRQWDEKEGIKSETEEEDDL